MLRNNQKRRKKMPYMQHPDQDVRQAIVWLTDALCAWERNTGRESVLILRETGGFVYRAVNGKPDVPADIKDTQLIESIGK
jgi:hypothetical protein